MSTSINPGYIGGAVPNHLKGDANVHAQFQRGAFEENKTGKKTEEVWDAMLMASRQFAERNWGYDNVDEEPHYEAA